MKRLLLRAILSSRGWFFWAGANAFGALAYLLQANPVGLLSIAVAVACWHIGKDVEDKSDTALIEFTINYMKENFHVTKR